MNDFKKGYQSTIFCLRHRTLVSLSQLDKVRHYTTPLVFQLNGWVFIDAGQSSQDDGDKVISLKLKHPTQPPQTLNKLNTMELRVYQKTKVDSLYEQTLKIFFYPNPTQKQPITLELVDNKYAISSAAQDFYAICGDCKNALCHCFNPKKV